MKKFFVFLWIIPIIISVMTLSVFAYMQCKAFRVSDVSEEVGYVFNDTTYDSKVIYDDLKNLKIQIEELLKSRHGDWSVYIKNLRTNAYISVNNDTPLKPASAIKIYNMAAFYNYINTEGRNPDEKEQELMNLMITVSDNDASNFIVSSISDGNFANGAKYVTDFAQSIGCINTIEEHMLFDHAPARGVSGRNLTTAEDCGILLEKIYKKECVSKEYDAKMLDLLLNQTRKNKIPAVLPEEIKSANKTGENDHVQADIAIVFSPVCDYILCVIENNDSEKSGIDGIKEISSITYNYFN